MHIKNCVVNSKSNPHTVPRAYFGIYASVDDGTKIDEFLKAHGLNKLNRSKFFITAVLEKIERLEKRL